MRLRHGTNALYELGCRCDLCREYQRARVARNRLVRRTSGRLNHGTRSAYDSGCRCDRCLQVRAESYQRLEVRRP